MGFKARARKSKQNEKEKKKEDEKESIQENEIAFSNSIGKFNYSFYIKRP